MPWFIFIAWSAAVLGLIIAVMQRDEFPGWGKMVVCALAATIPAAVVNLVLPPALFSVGLTVGAVCGGLAICATCGMGLKRASIAAGIYLGIQTAIGAVIYLGTR